MWCFYCGRLVMPDEADAAKEICPTEETFCQTCAQSRKDALSAAASVNIAVSARQPGVIDYEGTCGSVPFRVQIREDSPAYWYDSAVDDDAKCMIYDAIDLMHAN